MDSLDIHPRIINAVKKARLSDFGTILSLSAPDLQRLTQLSASDVRQLHKAAATAVPRLPATTALELHQKTGPVQLRRSTLTSGCNVIDSFLRGGFLSQTLTEVAGQSAAGKTQLCLQLCLMVQLPVSLGGLEAGAVYICTEDAFPNKRLLQMAELLRGRSTHPKVKVNFTDNIYIEHAAEMSDLWHCLSHKLPVLLSRGAVRLVIVDSIAALFRADYGSQTLHARANTMRKLACQLLKLATEFNIPVVCINQVSDLVTSSTSRPSGSKVIPALGLSWANLITTRLMLLRTNQNVAIPQKNLCGAVIGSAETVVRTMEVLFAPHLASSVCRYIVDQDGVKGLPV